MKIFIGETSQIINVKHAILIVNIVKMLKLNVHHAQQIYIYKIKFVLLIVQQDLLVNLLIILVNFAIFLV